MAKVKLKFDNGILKRSLVRSRWDEMTVWFPIDIVPRGFLPDSNASSAAESSNIQGHR